MSTTAAAASAQRSAAATTIDADRYLTFTLNGAGYGLDIRHVTEIIEYRDLTVVPMLPEFVRGVLNLRGRAVPVIDLAIRFATGATGLARRTSIIIVHVAAAGQDVGILVDAVNKVAGIPAADIEPPPAFGSDIRTDFLAGMARRDSGFVLLLDVARLLSPGDLESLRAAAAAAGQGRA